jgi:DNA polymerase III epsilon subunit-like protein
MNELFILDTETAGLTGGVCELAFLRVDFDLNILEEFCVRVNPERPIGEFATGIHGITDADVANCPTLAQVTAGIPSFAEPLIYVGHNCSFDQKMTAPFIRPSKSMCTLALSREYIKGTTNNKLATLQVELGLPVQKSHSALGDVHTTRDLLLHILPIAGVNLQTLLERADKPKLMAKMPFGEHKGITIMRVPRAYRAWMLEQSDIPRDLRYTLEKFRSL